MFYRTPTVKVARAELREALLHIRQAERMPRGEGRTHALARARVAIGNARRCYNAVVREQSPACGVWAYGPDQYAAMVTVDEGRSLLALSGRTYRHARSARRAARRFLFRAQLRAQGE
jgi:hypothetical protein